MIQDPSTRADTGVPPRERSREWGRSGELDWLLDDLVLRVSEVRHAVVLSNDGLAVVPLAARFVRDAHHVLGHLSRPPFPLIRPWGAAPPRAVACRGARPPA